MSTTVAVVVVVVAIIAVLIAGIAIHNRLVQRRNQVRNAWSQIDVQLKRRHDLVPNLVAIVKGYATHEQDIMASVVAARERAISAGSDVSRVNAAEQDLSGALRSLFSVAEAYPDLKASQNFALLQEELSSTENRLAFARQHYNDAVMEYNSARESFPAAVIAAPLGFTHADQLRLLDPAQRLPPAVEM